MGFHCNPEEPNEATNVVALISAQKPTTKLLTNHREGKTGAFWFKMACQHGFPDEISSTTGRRCGKKIFGGKEKGTLKLEQSQPWLLAESGGGEFINAEPHSYRSSFRLSLCSQVELESMKKDSSASATVLMVNLENGCSAPAKEVKRRRFQSLERFLPPFPTYLIRFSYREIASATNNFSEGSILGRGALSFVFRGRVGLWRTAVAIKKLGKEDKESSKAFCRELMIASSLRSPNIVPLIGYCVEPEEGLFLVYRFVRGGNLERHLHQRNRLPWSARYKAAVGIAQAIAYLHNGTERCVVHRDIKPSNILLTSGKTPKLCDFGLATWISSPSVPFLCKTVKGTFGYLAPEYFQHGKVSDKTDIYAFGVVLLELITGRKPIDLKNPPGEENLVLWAKPLLMKGKGAIEELLDPRLKDKHTEKAQVAGMILAAAACVTSDESSRPRIDEILAVLRGQEEPVFSSRRKSHLSGLLDFCAQAADSEDEMSKHLALAMLGVSELEDDDLL